MKNGELNLAITGMHRSGTSMVAHYLQLCGVNIGENLYPADKGNPKGYYEDIDFLKIHQDMLAYLGLSIFPTNLKQLRTPIPDEFRLRGKAILEKKKQLQIWGWKDCRTSLFLKFWHQLIPDIKVLFLFRHPISVVDSLLRRGTDKIISKRPGIGFQSWMIYNQQILDFYRHNSQNCFLIDVNNFVQNPSEAIYQLYIKLDIDLPIQDFNSAYVPEAFKLRYSTGNLLLLFSRPYHTLRCLRLYVFMKQLADWS